MKYRMLAITAIAVAGIISGALIGGDAESGDKVPPPFRIVFVSQIGARSEKAMIRAKATKARVATLQKELAADPILTTKLRARGVQIRNVIGREKAWNGATIIYVR